MFGYTHSLRQNDAEAMEKRRLGGVGLGDAAQADRTVGGGWQHDVMRLNPRQLVEHRTRRVSEAGALLPHLEAFHSTKARTHTRI
jgi:hypothetical protein